MGGGGDRTLAEKNNDMIVSLIIVNVPHNLYFPFLIHVLCHYIYILPHSSPLPLPFLSPSHALLLWSVADLSFQRFKTHSNALKLTS